jgi:hypothetical protein
VCCITWLYKHGAIRERTAAHRLVRNFVFRLVIVFDTALHRHVPLAAGSVRSAAFDYRQRQLMNALAVQPQVNAISVRLRAQFASVRLLARVRQLVLSQVRQLTIPATAVRALVRLFVRVQQAVKLKRLPGDKALAAHLARMRRRGAVLPHVQLEGRGSAESPIARAAPVRPAAGMPLDHVILELRGPLERTTALVAPETAHRPFTGVPSHVINQRHLAAEAARANLAQEFRRRRAAAGSSAIGHRSARRAATDADSVPRVDVRPKPRRVAERLVANTTPEGTYRRIGSDQFRMVFGRVVDKRAALYERFAAPVTQELTVAGVLQPMALQVVLQRK